MTTLTPGQYADLRDGRRLKVAPTRCTACGTRPQPATITGLAVARHNLRCAENGERSYLTIEKYRRAA